MLNSFTVKPNELPEMYRVQIEDIIKDVVKNKTDQ